MVAGGVSPGKSVMEANCNGMRSPRGSWKPRRMPIPIRPKDVRERHLGDEALAVQDSEEAVGIASCTSTRRSVPAIGAGLLEPVASRSRRAASPVLPKAAIGNASPSAPALPGAGGALLVPVQTPKQTSREVGSPTCGGKAGTKSGKRLGFGETPFKLMPTLTPPSKRGGHASSFGSLRVSGGLRSRFGDELPIDTVEELEALPEAVPALPGAGAEPDTEVISMTAPALEIFPATQKDVQQEEENSWREPQTPKINSKENASPWNVPYIVQPQFEVLKESTICRSTPRLAPRTCRAAAPPVVCREPVPRDLEHNVARSPLGPLAVVDSIYNPSQLLPLSSVSGTASEFVRHTTPPTTVVRLRVMIGA